jgi:RNA polymerase sigma-70 factor, ECF subfamily
MAVPDELVKRAKNGDLKALDALLERHLPMVYRFVSMRLGPDRGDLDDVVQETLIAAAGSIGSLRAERDGAVPAWFLTIARHKVADHFRRSSDRRVDLGAQAMDLHGTESPDVQELVGERDRDHRLRAAMRKLTPDQEEVLVLRFVLGFDSEQAAAISGRTVGAIKSLQHRGLASLEKLLLSEGEEWQ